MGSSGSPVGQRDRRRNVLRRQFCRTAVTDRDGCLDVEVFAHRVRGALSDLISVVIHSPETLPRP